MAVSAGMALMSTATAAITGGTLIGGFLVGGAGTLLTHFLVTTALGAAINALSPKPSSTPSGYNVTATGSALDHQIIYGRAKVGGVRVFDSTSGSNNVYLHRVIAFAGHEVESFDEIYINDEIATLDGTGNVTSPSAYNGYVRIKQHLGSPTQTADTDLVNEVEEWTTSHRLQGIAYLYIRLKYSQDAFPNGVPEITATIKGKKIYDPRNSTTVWSDNPALCVRDYLISDYGLNEESSNIDDTMFKTASDVCDTLINSKTRYTCNGNFTAGSTPYNNLQYLLTSMGGLLWYAQGKWRIKPAYWTAPVLTFDENDLRGPISISTRHSRRDNFNIVNGTFRGEESNWQVTDFPPVKGVDFIVADNGQESSVDLELPFTDNSIEARRIALISLERNRQQLTVQASFGLRAFQVQVGDNIILNNSRFGWSNKTFEVTSWTFGLADNYDLQVQMVLRETSESVFDEIEDGIVYERDNTTLLSPFFVPDIGLSVNASAQISSQKITNIANIVVTCSVPEYVDRVEVEYKKSSSSTWKSAGTGPLGEFEIVDLEVNFYDFRARAINTFGKRGSLYTASNVEVNPFTGPPSDVSNFIAEVSGNSLFMKWDAIPDPDLSHYVIKHNPAYTGATWNNSSTIVEKVARPSTSVAVPARAGTYLIKAYDKEGYYSTNAATHIIDAASIPPLGTIVTVTENPTFAGSKTNVILVSSTIEIDNTSSSAPTGTYFFNTVTDLTTVRNARITGYNTFSRNYDNGTLLWDNIPGNFDSWPSTFDNWTTDTTDFGDVNVQVYVSATLDNPAGTPTWGDYEPANAGYFLGRGFRFKAVLNSTSTYFTPNVSALSATIEY